MFLTTRNALGSTRRSPVLQLQKASNLFEKLLSDFEPFPVFSDDSEAGFVPKIDVKESDTSVRIKADIPGMTRDQIQVNLSDDALVISGTKKEEKEEHDEKNCRHYIERKEGSFSRTIPISCEIDHDKVDVVYKDGVLTVNLPKSAQARGGVKKLNIRAE